MPNASPTWMSILFFGVGLLALAALIYINPKSIESEFMPIWLGSLEILLYVFLGLAVFLVIWILRELNTSSKHYGIPELLGIIGITFTLLIIFANLYRAGGLIQNGSPITPTWAESIYFSISVFTSNGIGEFTPKPGLRIYIALESLIGFLMTPVIITMAFIIYQKKCGENRSNV
ncbi:MAG: hypothetical protein D6824_03735 [Planctomycetota bacterium]|nr:MAG: hypothetical protein D6824_03735 [Planctomycetota bacterium]